VTLFASARGSEGAWGNEVQAPCRSAARRGARRADLLADALGQQEDEGEVAQGGLGLAVQVVRRFRVVRAAGRGAGGGGDGARGASLPGRGGRGDGGGEATGVPGRRAGGQGGARHWRGGSCRRRSARRPGGGAGEMEGTMVRVATVARDRLAR